MFRKMFLSKTAASRRRVLRGRTREVRLQLEMLEPRQLLSASVQKINHFNITFPQTLSSLAAYVPAQVRSAYGFTGLTFGSVPADGRGQTIAIVDAYDDPNIASDLAVFD